MAKRHKHYNARGSGKPKSKKSKPHGSSSERTNERSGRTNKKRSELLLAGGDLMNPHMVDDYYFGSAAKKNSLRSGGFRPGKLLENDDLDAKRLPLRKRPVEFIKAKELYDPSHELILKLIQENSKHQILDETDSVDKPLAPQTPVVLSRLDIDKNGREGLVHIKDSDTKKLASERVITLSTQPGVDSSNNDDIEPADSLNDENKLFYVDVDGENDFADETVRTVEVEFEKSLPTEQKCTEFKPTLRIGNTEIHLKNKGPGRIEIEQPKSSYHPFHSYIENVMKNLQKYNSDDDFDENGMEVEHDVYSSSDDEFELTGQMSDANTAIDQFDESMKLLTIGKFSEKRVDRSLVLQNDLSRSETDTPAGDVPFGFCEDDFEGSIGKVFVSNIRVGAGTYSYYISCPEIYGDSASRWVDNDVMEDLIFEMGLPEHRHNAYYKHLHDSFIKEEKEPEEYFNIPLEDDDSAESSDSGGSQLESSEETDLGEDLEDLVSYSLKYSKGRNMECDTSSLQIRGKRRNKHLVFDQASGMDEDIKLMLQDKFALRESTKSKKRKTKDDYLSQSHAKSKDLLLKYPYGLHIHNIKDEFDAFYHSDRQTITFPPLDPHGNKVLAKFAYNYFMKASHIGKGKHSKVYIEKTKKTRNNNPAYHIISQLLKQRPVFMRIDQRAPAESASTFHRTVRLKVAKENFNISEGQIVGEDAPEIGTDNIGRRMLEKLGWNTGQGLGAHGNKGINEPILAKVKKSKSGLRHHSNNE
ncbi:unnamed protein product [Kluyveromyces dobzhanskii CBS 2104]|uniref:Protein SQS1 n=1 Tax=Kluyveromyces dobzhanskii CBS 2104 TaxID=1427455 RepID=A0A0A8L7I9_9SACH|nr:unnamed protein product [Kluyveromyces dobzhanskii CBS 2104]